MKRILLFIIPLIMFACDNPSKPTPINIETSFDKGGVTRYGKYYEEEGIKQNVFDLDVYSKNLGLDSVGKMYGTGTNLYISDIFLPEADTILAEGTYTMDSTGVAFSYLQGIQCEGNVSGAYLLIMGESGYTVDLIKEGTFVVVQEDDTTQIDFNLIRSSGSKYEATFRGVLKYENYWNL